MVLVQVKFFRKKKASQAVTCLVRNTSTFYKIFLIDPRARKAVQLCPFVRTGVMHRDFQAKLREDGLGIDYKKLSDYDTAKKIEDYMVSQHPLLEKQIKLAIERRNKIALLDVITMAKRFKLDKRNPQLMLNATAELNLM
jgi:hypothetical protein